MPFGFLKRRKPEDAPAGGPASSQAPATSATEPASSPAGITKSGGVSPTAGSPTTTRIHEGNVRGVQFTAITEDWRLRGRMQIAGRLTDALNKREAITISDVSWGPSDGTSPMEPAPGIKSVDPYDLILVIAGEDSLPPLTDAERSALKVHKVPYEVALELPPFRIIGTIFMHPGSEPDRLLDRSSEMFTPVADAVAHLGDIEVSDPEVEVILVNRFYLRGVEQVDRRTGAPHPRLPGRPLGGTS
ncbi:MAG TPA: hypothetical protein VFQ75_04495 [Candidatus Limnocylindrales bacterium]|nr:hypothetical protein [Candidatus Limnocylindrales bacterium]